MVNYRAAYQALLQRGAQALDELLQLYTPDIRAAKDWADVSTADTRNKRNSLMERLAAPLQVTADDTSTLVMSLGHYLDSHWADYQEDFPVANPQKRARLEVLHAQLAEVTQGIGEIYNALRTP
ncbi:hypothetical protein ACFST9_21325 [Hymenobacter monticola]|uniref:Transposase n=1 Tax=Hymenobacter monticola TaxID=1705399 RepID=A0ABY4B661_9BACT|nr:hypothetical protein [Hymenobacter monticola]UOE34359.1 hypothetical protein MTP16_01585 [Hymenobacter monticola]